jgi:hypothetical protein
MSNKNYTCVQCGKQLAMDDWFSSFCANPACPNYALLAIPLEDMPKEEK